MPPLPSAARRRSRTAGDVEGQGGGVGEHHDRPQQEGLGWCDRVDGGHPPNRAMRGWLLLTDTFPYSGLHKRCALCEA